MSVVIWNIILGATDVRTTSARCPHDVRCKKGAVEVLSMAIKGGKKTIFAHLHKTLYLCSQYYYALLDDNKPQQTEGDHMGSPLQTNHNKQ